MKSGILLTAANVFSSVASLLRNIVIARIVSVEDFGVSALIALSVSVIEMLSNLGSERFIVQHKNGDSLELQASIHSILLLKGFIGSCVLYILAENVSRYLNAGYAVDAFKLISIIPLIRGFVHVEYARMQRHYSYSSAAYIELSQQLFSLLAIYPLSFIFKNYMIMAWVIVVQSLAFTTASHLVARSHYYLAFKNSYFAEMLEFGWPLIINGLLTFLALQLDKGVIAKYYSVESLGIYNSFFLIGFALVVLFWKLTQAFFVPWLSTVRADSELFESRCNSVFRLHSFFALSVLVLLNLFGEYILLFLYGEKFVVDAALIIAFGVYFSISIARSSFNVVAISVGNTRLLMLASVMRALSVPLIISFAFNGFELQYLIYSSAFGELAALYFVSYKISKMRNTVYSKTHFIILYYLIMLIFISLLSGYLIKSEFDSSRILFSSFIIALIIFINKSTLNEFKSYIHPVQKS